MNIKPLFHKFGNKKINVYNIISVWYHKRLFKIFDRDFDYELSIKYKLTNKGVIYTPIYYGTSGAFLLFPTTIDTETNTLRYKYKDDVINEYNKIILKCRHVQNNIKNG